MERESPNLNVPCIEQSASADWYDSPERLIGCIDQRFKERDLREERDAIIGSSWAWDLFSVSFDIDCTSTRGFIDTVEDSDRNLVVSVAKDIEELLEAMSQGKSLSRSPEYLELCDRLAAAISDEGSELVDITEWSNRLAEDLSTFSD
jgi:hypothetical protein